MPTLVTKTVKASAGDYTSLTAWESGQQADLVTADQIQRVECYGIADTAAAQHIDGWTTDATRYIEVATVGADRASPAWSTGKYRLTGSNFALIIDEDYVRLDGLQLAATAGTSVVNTTGAGEVRVSNCFLDGAEEAVGAGSSTGGVLKIWNCILSAGATSYGLHAKGTNCTTYIYNCTCVNGNVGVFCQNAGATVVAKNVIGARNSGVQFLLSSGTMTCTNCASADATADDNGGSGNRINQTFTFAGASDYHLDASDAGAKDFGVDLSADADIAFSTDMDGDARSGSWDVGADEVAAAALSPVGFGGTKAQPAAKGPRDRRGFLLQRMWDYTVAAITNTNVATDVGSLVLNGFASVLNLGIATGVGALTLTGFAPAAVVGTVVASNVGALTLAGFAPSVVVGTVITPGVGALTLTGQAPSATIGTVVFPGVGALTLSGFAPALNTKINTGVGALTLNGFSPTLDSKIVTGVGALTLSGFAPIPAIGVNIQTGVGALTLTGLSPSIVATNNKVAATGVGQLILTGFAPDTLQPNPLPFWFSLRSAAMSTFTASTSGAQWTSTAARQFGWTSTATRQFPWRP